MIERGEEITTEKADLPSISSMFMRVFFVRNFGAKAETYLEKAAKKGRSYEKFVRKTLMKLTPVRL